MASQRLTPTAGRDSLLVALTVASGAVDAISFIALGKVFTAFMTGNLVFLGLRAAGAPGPDVLTVLISLAAFAVGVFASTRIVRASKGSGVWPNPVTGALGLVAVAQAAFAAGWIAVSGQPTGGMIDLLVGISALAMGIQSGAILSLGVTGVFTTAATATLMYLSKELAAESTTAGGLLLVHARTFAALLPLAMTILVVAIAYDPLGKREGPKQPESDASEFEFGWRSERRANGAARRRPIVR